MGVSIRTQSVPSTCAHYSYSNASPSTPVCIRLRDQSLTYAPGTHACHKAVDAPPPRLFNVVWPAFHIDLPAVDISQPLSRTYKSVSVKQFKLSPSPLGQENMLKMSNLLIRLYNISLATKLEIKKTQYTVIIRCNTKHCSYANLIFSLKLLL